MSGRMSGKPSKMLRSRYSSTSRLTVVGLIYPEAEAMEGKNFEKSDHIECQRLLYRTNSSRFRAGYMDRKALEEVPVVQETGFI